MIKKYDINDNKSYILGISLIVEALIEVPSVIDSIYLSSKAIKNKELDKLILLANKYQIKIIEDDNVINKLSLKENCYGIGIFNKYQKELSDNKHLVLYGFIDEGQLGTIIRSAVSFDYKDIVLIDSDIDIFNPKVIRASMGSFFHVNIKKFDNLNNYLNEYKQYNFYPFTGSEDIELKMCEFKKPYAIIIPYKYHLLDNKFKKEYFIKHHNIDELSLTSISSIVLNYSYHLNLKR